MKKIIILMISTLLLVGCSNNCTLDGNSVCVNEDTGIYLLEPETKLTIAVEEPEYGDAIVGLWNNTYPEFKDAVTYVVYENMDIEEFNENYVDLPILWDVYAIGIEDQFRGLSDNLVSTIDDNVPENFKLHTREYKYVPMSAIGSTFATNVTYLENNGIDITDSNDDGLVDAIDTFEEIKDLDIYTKLHLYLDDYYTSYFIGTNGFKLFDQHDPYDVGFDSEEFKEALDTTSQLADIVEEVDNFIYPNDLANADVPFIISLPTMLIKEEEASNKVNYVFSKFPSFKGNDFYTLANSKGYLISNDCLYPSSANALLDLIRSNTGMQLYLDNTDEYMVVNNFEDYNYHSNNREGISKSYLNGYVSESASFVGNEEIKASDMLDDIQYFEIVKQVFYHELSVEDAQNTLVERAEDWYSSNNLVEENVSE